MTEHPRIIPKDQLKHGVYYRGRCRNATVARWNEKDQQFYYWRNKWGRNYVEAIRHREDFIGFDVFDAFEEMAEPTEEIPFN